MINNIIKKENKKKLIFNISKKNINTNINIRYKIKIYQKNKKFIELFAINLNLNKNYYKQLNLLEIKKRKIFILCKNFKSIWNIINNYYINKKISFIEKNNLLILVIPLEGILFSLDYINYNLNDNFLISNKNFNDKYYKPIENYQEICKYQLDNFNLKNFIYLKTNNLIVIYNKNQIKFLDFNTLQIKFLIKENQSINYISYLKTKYLAVCLENELKLYKIKITNKNFFKLIDTLKFNTNNIYSLYELKNKDIILIIDNYSYKNIWSNLIYIDYVRKKYKLKFFIKLHDVNEVLETNKNEIVVLEREYIIYYNIENEKIIKYISLGYYDLIPHTMTLIGNNKLLISSENNYSIFDNKKYVKLKVNFINDNLKYYHLKSFYILNEKILLTGDNFNNLILWKFKNNKIIKISEKIKNLENNYINKIKLIKNNNFICTIENNFLVFYKYNK